MSFFYFNGAKEKLGRSPGQASNEDDSFLWNQGNFYPTRRRPAPAPRAVEGRRQPRVRLESVRERASTRGSAGATASRRAAGPTRTAASTSTTTRRYGSWFTYTARKPWHIIDVSGSAFKSASGGTTSSSSGSATAATRTTRRRAGAAVGSRRRTSTRPDDKFALAYRARVVNFVGAELRRVLRRHVQQGPLDGQRRHPVGPSDGRERRQRRAGQYRVSRTLLPAVRSTAAVRRSIGTTSHHGRHHLRARREPQDGRPRVVRALCRPAQSVRGDGVEPGRRLLHVHRLQVDRHQRRRSRAEERDPHQPRAAVLATTSIRRNPTSVDVAVNTIDPNYHANHDNEFIVGLDHELMPNFVGRRARTPSGGRDDFPTWNPRIGLTSRRLHRRRRSSSAARTAAIIFSAERREGRRDRRRPHPDEPARLPSDLQRARVHAEQAAVEQVDGARGVLATWTGPSTLRARAPCRTRRAPTRPVRRRVLATLSGPQVDGGPDRAAIRRLGQGRHLLQREVAVQRQRVLSARLGVRPRREYVRPSGLRASRSSIQDTAGGDGRLRVAGHARARRQSGIPNLFGPRSARWRRP